MTVGNEADRRLNRVGPAFDAAGNGFGLRLQCQQQGRVGALVLVPGLKTHGHGQEEDRAGNGPFQPR